MIIKKELNLINHTHWDREWYESFEIFRGKLVEGIKYIINGLEKNKFDYFMLDGQTIILEDLREALEDEIFNKLEEYIKNGKMEIGPWYVLPDEFLVSGESLIRNLEIGIDISKTYGKNEFIGYLPDTFGHIGQLPQIFNNFGIKWCLLWRGVKSKKSEAYFIGSDGTEIKALILPLWTGYYNYFLNDKNYYEKLKEYIKEVEKFSTEGQMLLLNGADHIFPHEDLRNRLEKVGKELNLNIKQVKLLDYTKKMDNVELEDKIYGEQRDETKCYILTNTLSARTYQKIKNQRLEDRITQITEPMELIKSLIKNEYKFKSLEYSFKTLLKNHPHDSICGCSIDAVCRDMDRRSENLNDSLEIIEHYASKEVISFNPVDNSKLFIFNPHPYKYKTVIDMKLQLPTSIKYFKLLDNKKENVDLVIHSRKILNVFKADIDLEPNWHNVAEFEVSILAEFEGLGYKELTIEKANSSSIYKEIGNIIENEYLSIEVNSDGTLNITNKETGRVYNRMNEFVSSLDCGDTYSYSPPIKDRLSKAKVVNINYVNNNEIYSEVTIYFELITPRSLNSDRTEGSVENEVSTIETKVRLLKNKKTIYFESKINNRAKDHRIKVIFPVGKKVEKFFTDVSFDVVERKPVREPIYYVEPMKEIKVNTFPTDSYVKIQDDFSVIQLGIQECEILPYTGGFDAVTLNLMRAVGWLSRSDFMTRGGGAGPAFETPEAQCLGETIYNYGITFEENVALESRIMRIKPKAILGNEIAKGIDGILTLDNKDVLVSALYKNKKNQVILRLYNTTKREQIVSINSVWNQYINSDFLGNELNREESEMILRGLQIKTLILKK